MQEDTVSNVTIQPNQSLLLRCRIKTYFDPYPEWDHDGVTLNYNKSQCHPDTQEVFDQYNTCHIIEA